MVIRPSYRNLSHDAAFALWKAHFDRQRYLLRRELLTDLQKHELDEIAVKLAELEYVLALWRSQLRLSL